MMEDKTKILRDSGVPGAEFMPLVRSNELVVQNVGDETPKSKTGLSLKARKTAC